MDGLCLILAGGDPALLPDRIPESIALVIAADSGVHLATRLGLAVDLIVGDLDSARPEAVDRAERDGAVVERHPTDKDATDLELALEAAVTRGARKAIIVGGTSLDRIDHLLANAALIAAPRFAGLEVEWWLGASKVRAARGTLTLGGAAGDLVSIISTGGDAEISTAGLRWPLEGALLSQGTTRGISNEMIGTTATISVTAGTALVVHTRRQP